MCQDIHLKFILSSLETSRKNSYIRLRILSFDCTATLETLSILMWDSRYTRGCVRNHSSQQWNFVVNNYRHFGFSCSGQNQTVKPAVFAVFTPKTVHIKCNCYNAHYCDSLVDAMQQDTVATSFISQVRAGGSPLVLFLRYCWTISNTVLLGQSNTLI